MKEGVKLVFNKLRATLQNKGLKAMDSINTDFDVEQHEAITEIPAPSDELKGKVVDDVQKGYYLNDKNAYPARKRLSLANNIMNY